MFVIRKLIIFLTDQQKKIAFLLEKKAGIQEAIIVIFESGWDYEIYFSENIWDDELYGTKIRDILTKISPEWIPNGDPETSFWRVSNVPSKTDIDSLITGLRDLDLNVEEQNGRESTKKKYLPPKSPTRTVRQKKVASSKKPYFDRMMEASGQKHPNEEE